MTVKAARVLEDTFDICSRILAKGGHFLPSTKREELLTKYYRIRKTLTLARAEHYGVKDSVEYTNQVPNIIEDMYSFIDRIKHIIDEQLDSSVDRIQRIYGIED